MQSPPRQGADGNSSLALTVDVEDYFQVSAFENLLSINDWSALEHRVEANTDKILELFAQKNATATFFTLGWVAKQYPSLIKKIVEQGHELASHGFYHQRLHTLNKSQIINDISSSKALLEDLSGKAVVGYRAPSFSIDQRNLWVLDILAELGFNYSSSTYPVKHDLYGEPDGHRQPHMTKAGIWEFPMSTLKLKQQNIPISGGGYFRLLPLWLSKLAINRFLKDETMPYMFYFHPWEIDPHQPYFKQASFKSRFRHYANLSKMLRKISSLLDGHQWQSIEQVYAAQLKQVPIKATTENKNVEELCWQKL